MKINKQAQVATGLSWFVATIVILTIIVISIIVATPIGILKQKKISFTEKYDDLIATKSFYAFLNTAEGGGKVYDQINNDGEFNERSTKIAQSIFETHSAEEISIWIALLSPDWEIIKEQVIGDLPKITSPSETPQQQIRAGPPRQIVRTIRISDDYKIRMVGTWNEK